MKTHQRLRQASLPAGARQRGVVLIAALAVLLMLTLLSMGMFRGFGLEERITGNAREKQHAFYAAQTALQYAEQQLLSPTLGQPLDCVPSITLSPDTVTVCDPATTPAQSAVALPANITNNWSSIAGATSYVLPSTFSTASTSAGQSTYLYATPQYQVSFIGVDPSTQGGFLYTVTSLGFGANANAAAVLQSVYSVVPAVTVNSNSDSY